MNLPSMISMILFTAFGLLPLPSNAAWFNRLARADDPGGCPTCGRGPPGSRPWGPPTSPPPQTPSGTTTTTVIVPPSSPPPATRTTSESTTSTSSEQSDSTTASMGSTSPPETVSTTSESTISTSSEQREPTTASMGSNPPPDTTRPSSSSPTSSPSPSSSSSTPTTTEPSVSTTPSSVSSQATSSLTLRETEPSTPSSSSSQSDQSESSSTGVPDSSSTSVISAGTTASSSFSPSASSSVPTTGSSVGTSGSPPPPSSDSVPTTGQISPAGTISSAAASSKTPPEETSTISPPSSTSSSPPSSSTISSEAPPEEISSISPPSNASSSSPSSSTALSSSPSSPASTPTSSTSVNSQDSGQPASPTSSTEQSVLAGTSSSLATAQEFTLLSTSSSTATSSDTTFVTVIVSTVISRVSSTPQSSGSLSPSVGGAPVTGSFNSPSMMSSTGFSWLTVDQTVAPIPSSSVSDACWFGGPSWCASSPTSSVPSSSYCLCPTCYFADALCSAVHPTDTLNCPIGWICSVTLATDGSGPKLSFPPGIASPTTTATPDPWFSAFEIITATDGSGRTTRVDFDAELKTMTVFQLGWIRIEFPFRDWHCLGPLCDLAISLPCIVKLFCPPKPKNIWPEPPRPAIPPVGPPGLAPETAPKTYTDTPTSSTPSTSLSSSDGSSTSSSSSCSASAVSTCSVTCSTTSVSSSASEVCSTTCTTVTTCSGTDVTTTTTTTTTGDSCSISQFWNDPALSSSIASWISQFPFMLSGTLDFSSMTASPSIISLSGISQTTVSPDPNGVTAGVTKITPTTTGITSTLARLPATSRTTVSTNNIGDVFSGIVASSGGQTSWVSSTQISTRIVETPVTLTSTSRSFTDVDVFTCGGIRVGESSSCTTSFELATRVSTSASPAEVTRHCADWSPDGSLIFIPPPPEKASGQQVCATFTGGPEATALPTPWTAGGKAYNWFKSDEDTVKDFCDRLAKSQIVLRADDPDEKNSPGECSTYHGNDGYELSLGRYGISIAIAYDPRACKEKDKYAAGVDFKEWAKSHNCKETFMDHIIDKCTVKGSTKKALGIGDFDSIGGIYYQDCMRFTVLAANPSLQPPDTLQNDGWPPTDCPKFDPDHPPSCEVCPGGKEDRKGCFEQLFETQCNCPAPCESVICIA